jgi:deoxyribonuclease IV
MSIAGGVDRALSAGKENGCEVVQIFTKSSGQWAARPLPPQEVEAFRRRQEELAIPLVAAHDSYLINLCSPDEALWRRSLEAFRIEIARCEALGIPYLIAHPGAHCGAGERAAFDRIARGLDAALDATDAGRTLAGRKSAGARAQSGGGVMVLLEITAGQGSNIGHRFEHMAEILARVRRPERVGICFDTCHAHAAGYDLRSEEGYHRTFEEFDRVLGLGRLRAFHLNDCKKELGCRVDRHWHIGRGLLGIEPFRLLMNDPRFEGIPGFLETPKGADYAEDRINLRTLRRLIGDTKARRIPSRMTLLPGSLVKTGRRSTDERGRSAPRSARAGRAGAAAARARLPVVNPAAKKRRSPGASATKTRRRA